MRKTAIIFISIVGLVLLLLSLFNLRNTFELINSTTANLIIRSCTIHGITFLCKAKVNIESALGYNIELAQLKITDASGKHIDSWTGEIKNKENFLISFSNVEFFSKKFEKVFIDGFVRVKLNVGQSGIKINLPVKAEVSFVGR